MRWLAAALVLANLGVWMWILWYAEQPTEAAAPPPRAEIRAEQMRLAGERGVRLTPRPAPPPAEAPAAQAPAVALGCYRLGPFADAEAADAAGKQLAAKPLGFEKQKEERRTVTGYRVFLPPFPTRQAAEARRRELTRLGFHDHAVISEEGMQNAVSLGVYAIEANAQKHLARLAARKVQAQLQPLYQERTVFWLDLRLEEPVADELRKADWGKDVALVTESCPQVPGVPPAAIP